MGRQALLFSFRSIPELRHVPHEVRDALWKRAVRSREYHWSEAVVFVAGLVAIMLSVRIGTGLGAGGSRVVSHLLISVAVGIAWGIAGVNIIYRRTRARLRAELAAAGRCTACGYDVRASSARCPECGSAVIVSGGDSRPR
jgi:predicted RNA-binding Zn-ribbon protein involved in translation (DUF1610 family)